MAEALASSAVIGTYGRRRAGRGAVLVLGLVAGVLSAVLGAGPAAAAATDVSPFGSIDQFTTQQYQDLHGRVPTASELSAARTGLAAGTTTTAQAVDDIAHRPGAADRTCNVTRLYTAYFLRNPDQGGLTYWAGKARTGTTLIVISNGFARSNEFVNRYGRLTDAGFVDLAFTNIFERPADPGGRTYWTNKLRGGTSRGQMMASLSQSNEYRRKQAVTCEAVLAHSALLGRVPTGTAFADAVARVADGGFVALAADLLASATWRNRFPVPGGVTGLKAIPDGGKVTLTWTAPPASSEPLSGYVVRPFIGAAAQAVRFVGVGTSATITGLTNGTSYRFEVVARNRFADGPAVSSPVVLVNPEARWTGYRGGPAHTGTQPVGDLPDTLTAKWEAKLTDLTLELMVADGLVYALVNGTSPGAFSGARVYALSPATGAVVWGPVAISATYPGAVMGYGDGKVFLGNDDGLIKAVDAATGASRWSVNLGGYTYDQHGLTIRDTTLYTFAGEGLTAVNTANGQVRWRRQTMNNSGTPAADASGVYASQVCNYNYRFSLAGSPVWDTSTGCTGGGGGMPVLHQDKVWVHSDWSGQASILQQSNGALFDAPATSEPPALQGNRAVYNNAGTLQGATWNDGLVRWSQAGEGDLMGPPVINADDTYIGSDEGRVYAFDVVTGQQTWSRDVLLDLEDPPDRWDARVWDLAVGGGLLLVPVGGSLVAYG